MSSGSGFPKTTDLMEAARRQTGLDDFGDDYFIEGLERFVASLEGELQLGAVSAASELASIQRRLVNRLEIEQWFHDNRAASAIEVGPPVTITGLPRTGTTALVNMLSLDSQFQRLRMWEQLQPCPPPVEGADETDPRRLAAIAEKEKLSRERPDLMAMHLFDPDATEEDVEILGLTFRAQQFVLPIYDYHAWWRDTNLDEAFAYHRRAITLLQSGRKSNSWLFKAPAHQYHLEAFVKAYPGAKIIMTHRDPAKAVPSAISFSSNLQPSDLKVDASELGRRKAEHLRIGCDRAIEARTRIGEDCFFDIHHRAFLADPFGTIERLYAFLERPWTSETQRKMEDWYSKNHSGAHGAHSYTPEDFGLSVQQIRADFRNYMDRFSIEAG